MAMMSLLSSLVAEKTVVDSPTISLSSLVAEKTAFDSPFSSYFSQPLRVSSTAVMTSSREDPAVAMNFLGNCTLSTTFYLFLTSVTVTKNCNLPLFATLICTNWPDLVLRKAYLLPEDPSSCSSSKNDLSVDGESKSTFSCL